MRGMHVARVKLFFSFQHRGVTYPCAVVEWFQRIDNNLDPITGMWVVEPEFEANRMCNISVIHLNAILRGAHLLPIFGEDFRPFNFYYSLTLDSFRGYYMNKYVDNHAFEILHK
jgi:hypothetical protein